MSVIGKQLLIDKLARALKALKYDNTVDIEWALGNVIGAVALLANAKVLSITNVEARAANFIKDNQ